TGFAMPKAYALSESEGRGGTVVGRAQ
ncbi:MAG: hypothetical protein QOI61_2451, partial [Actinomycetota bacterium]